MDLTLIRSASLFYFPWGGAIAASQLLVLITITTTLYSFCQLWIHLETEIVFGLM